MKSKPAYNLLSLLPTCPPLGQPSLQVGQGPFFLPWQDRMSKAAQSSPNHLAFSLDIWCCLVLHTPEVGGKNRRRWDSEPVLLQIQDAAGTTGILVITALQTLIPDGSRASLSLELGGDKNSVSLQLVAGSDSAGREPLSFLHCSLPECPGAPWLVLLKARACRVPLPSLLLSVGFCLQTLWRMGVPGRRLGPEDKCICGSSQPSLLPTRASSMKLQLKTSLILFQNCRLFLEGSA